MYNQIPISEYLKFDYIGYLKLIGHKSAVTAIKVIKDKIIISGSKDGELIVWQWSDDRNSIELKKRLSGHREQISDIITCFSEKDLITSSHDGTIRIWDLQNGDNYKCKTVLTGHTDKVLSISISLTNMLFSSSQDQTIKIWDYEKGICQYSKTPLLSTSASNSVVSLVYCFSGSSVVGHHYYYSDNKGNIQKCQYFPFKKDQINDVNWISLPTTTATTSSLSSSSSSSSSSSGNENGFKTNSLIISPDFSIFAIDSSIITSKDKINMFNQNYDQNEPYDPDNKQQSLIYIWDIGKTDEPILTFGGVKGNIEKLKFSPTKYMLFAIYNDSIAILDLLSFKELQFFSKLYQPHNYISNNLDLKSKKFNFQSYNSPKPLDHIERIKLSKCLSLDIDSNNCIYIGHENGTISVYKSDYIHNYTIVDDQK